jgi:hypothetical protein
MSGRLEVGDVLGEVFSIYGAQAGVLLPIAFWIFLVVAIVDRLVGNDLALFPVVLAVSTVAATLFEGVVVNMVRNVQEGRHDARMGELVGSALPFLLPLIGAGLLFGLGVGIGFVLLIVPGLFLMTIWAVIAPAIVVEGKGVGESFERSRRLVRGHGWPVFRVIVVAGMITVVGSLTLGAVALRVADGPLVQIVLSTIASTITAPVGALVAVVVYYRLLGFEAATRTDVVAPADPAGPTGTL